MKNKELYRVATQTALDNAFDIFEEAALLYDKEKYPRAFALCMLSLEELTKSFIYRCVSVGLIEEKGINIILRDHTEKIINSGHLMTFTILFVKHSDELNKAIEHDRKHEDHKDHIYTQVLGMRGLESANEVIETLKDAQEIKLDTIYVDVRRGKIINPKEVITKSKIHKAFSNAGLVLGLMKPLLESNDDQFTTDTTNFLSPTVEGIKMDIKNRLAKKK